MPFSVAIGHHESVLIRVGYWASHRDPTLPRPEDMIDGAWDDRERDLTARYFASGTKARLYMGPSMCRLCGKPNGNEELSDGVYIWPEGLSHYVTVHGVRLPPELVAHAESRIGELEDADTDETWWRNQTRRP